jgi:hypothetical protein
MSMNTCLALVLTKHILLCGERDCCSSLRALSHKKCWQRISRWYTCAIQINLVYDIYAGRYSDCPY